MKHIDIVSLDEIFHTVPSGCNEYMVSFNGLKYYHIAIIPLIQKILLFINDFCCIAEIELSEESREENYKALKKAGLDSETARNFADFIVQYSREQKAFDIYHDD